MSSKKGNKVPKSLEDPQERQAWLKSLSSEELQAVREYAWDQLLKGHKVVVDGKTIPFKVFRDRMQKEQQAYDRGLYDEDIRSIPRAQAKALLTSKEARPGAMKEMLREEEEKELQLEKLGNGNVFSPRKVFGKLFEGKRDFAYGLYARPDNVEVLLRKKWAGREPSEILENPDFYSDIIKNCHAMELTLMVYPVRPLRLSKLQPAIREKLQSGAERLAGGPLQPEDKADLEDFVRLFDEPRLAPSSWVDKGKVKEGTHIIVAAVPNGTLTVEAITPGTLQQRKTSYVGLIKNSLVAKAAFEAFLGPEPIDSYGKLAVGHGALWCANGFRLTGEQEGVYDMVLDSQGKPTFALPETREQVAASTELFRLDFDEKPRMLLTSIRRKQPLDKRIVYA